MHQFKFPILMVAVSAALLLHAEYLERKGLERLTPSLTSEERKILQNFSSEKALKKLAEIHYKAKNDNIK